MPQAAPTAAATRRAPAVRDTSIATYRDRRDFAATPEPPARRGSARKQAPIFVVQKHHARRLHWDFRLEHGGVLWSWAVPKGPSLDPADKRLAVHVEDHPLDYADFAGTIPAGQYGAGDVETWDRGTWEPVGNPEEGLRRGELKFVLHGKRLNGHFVLVRLKPRERERAENWLLIKERDDAERRGADAAALESSVPAPKPRRPPAKKPAEQPPAPGAVRAPMPQEQTPQLAAAVDQPPNGGHWLSELKFDGYRMLAFLDHGKARLVTRSGLDWTAKMPAVARAVARLGPKSALLDGELVALRGDGVSSFPELQAALTEGHDDRLFFYTFDLLYLNGWDLRGCTLRDRKALLAKLSDWRGSIRYSDHVDTDPGQFRRQACDKGLEGIICKQADAPYRPGRGRTWLKLKCQDREEFIVLGWTWPEGMRTGLGSLHLGFYDASGGMHYAGGVGTGFSDKVLADLRSRLDQIAAPPPPNLQYAGDPPERGINWVKPELLAEVRFAGWSGFGRLRHASFLGLREDKPAAEVVRPIPDPEASRTTLDRRLSPGGNIVAGPTRIVQAAPPRKPAQAPARPRALALASAIIARSPKHVTDVLEGAHLTHPDRELWPGITKRDLAAYWVAVADHALPEIAQRPLALVRCPEGIGGEHFFQKHGRPGMPAAIRAGKAGGAPYLAIDNDAGLVACAQIAAIELHPWGAIESDPLHPDRLIFDLDPGEGVPFAEVARAALEVRDRLKALGLASFCRTTGGKGLHAVVPLHPKADWDTARAWCRRFAETMERDAPDRYVASVPKKKRVGRILVDWLRNGLGSTAVASLCPRARAGAAVAMPVAWREVTARLDPARFTIATVPAMLARRTSDPWSGIFDVDQVLPDMPGDTEEKR